MTRPTRGTSLIRLAEVARIPRGGTKKNLYETRSNLAVVFRKLPEQSQDPPYVIECTIYSMLQYCAIKCNCKYAANKKQEKTTQNLP